MIVEPRKNRQTAPSAIKSVAIGVEVIKNTDSLDHWDFLEEIEAPMWADLSVCDLSNEIDDPWFNISHPFHQCSSSQLRSTVFRLGKGRGSNPISIQEPHSPKLPPSVSKSRGKGYEIKEWKQRSKVTSNKQHPVKTLTRRFPRSIGSRNNANPTSKTKKVKDNKDLKVRSSCESGLTDTSRNQCSKSCSSSARQEQEQGSSSKSTVTYDQSENQEKKCMDFSRQTSSQSNGLLSSLRINLRRSRASRPAARVVTNGEKPSEGCKSSSSISSAGFHLDQGSVGKKFNLGDAQNTLSTLDDIKTARVCQPPRNKSRVPNLQSVTKVPASNLWSLSNRQGSNVLASKGTSKEKVQQHRRVGKVLMPHKVNEQYKITYNKSEKVGVGFPGSNKENASSRIATRQKPKPGDKQIAAQKNGITKPKEKAKAQESKDKVPAIPARKVYFR